MFWLPFVPLMLSVLGNACYFPLVRPARKRQKARRSEPPKPVAERREPRDTSRPYPRPADVTADDERMTVCPVCGMEDPLFLDGGPSTGDLFGWPAHGTCVEWLGKWEPPPGPQPMPKYSYVGGQVIPSEPVYLGGTAVTIPGGMTMAEFQERMAMAVAKMAGIPSPASGPSGSEACDCGMCFNGTAAEIARSMDVHMTSGQHDQRVAYLNRMEQALPEKVTHMWCTCGKPFDGTPLAVKQAMDAHHASGECPHSPNHQHPRRETA